LVALREKLTAEKGKRAAERKLWTYRPYKKQAMFHALSATVRERLFMAGNQLGKTWSGAFEMAMHLTGEYPDWWEGRRFDRAIRAIAGSESSELTRDAIQRLLVGPPEDESLWGTGAIPKERIASWSRKAGVPNALDSVTVRCKAGGTSTILFKSYDQGRGKWQANTVDIVWFDEEPPQDIYSEGLTRTNATKGMVYMTFTPLLGMSEVVRRFLHESSVDRSVTTMTIHDAEHYTEEERERIIRSYPEHEREARASGIPILGSGRIFPLADSSVVIQPIQIPHYWPRIAGIDFGWDHPTAAVELAWDRDTDTVYVIREHRVSQNTPQQHGASLRPWGSWLPWAWPHDGLQADKGSGEQLAKQYKTAGLKMLPNRATFVDGSSSVEAGLLDMLDRMKSGRFKVFANCVQWMEEFRLYHRKDGKIVKEHDDLISASRYATMMLRYARMQSSDRYGVASKPLVAEGIGEIENW
jgi:phage terminase large subunit-like protein